MRTGIAAIAPWPGLDQVAGYARQEKFNGLPIRVCDRLARSVMHLLQSPDEIGPMKVEFIGRV